MATPTVKFFALNVAVVALFLGRRLSTTGVWPVSIVLPDLPTSSPKLFSNVEVIGAHDLVGPESLVTSTPPGRRSQEVMFAALGDGRIVRLTEKDAMGNGGSAALAWETLLRTGTEPGGSDAPAKCGAGGPADATNTESVCGRPLGLLVVKRRTVDPSFAAGGGSPKQDEDEDALVVADAYKGLLLITGIYGGEKNDAAPAPAVLRVLATRADGGGDGEKDSFRLLNAAVQAPDGSVYFTETSRKFPRRRIFHAVFDGRPTGRLLRYRRGVGSGEGAAEVEAVADGLYLPNGITLSHDKKSLLIVAGVQILRYSLERGEMDREPFVSVMHGTGDNIKAMSRTPTGEKRECYWAGLGSQYAEPFSLLKALSEKPWLRALLVAVVPYEEIVEAIPKMSAFAVFDAEGGLIETYRDSETVAPWVSEAEPMGEHIYLASWYNPFLARVKRQELR